MQNVEFKAELRDPSLARTILGPADLGAAWIVTLHQTDTYFRIPSARLKKRECPGEPTEYIFYDRADRAHPKMSHFKIYSEAQALERFGASPLPVRIVVRKTRDLFMYGNVRIHLDQVEGLGWFIELEALVSPQHNVARCHETIAMLRERLATALGEAIAVGYADMLEGEQAPAEEPR